MLSTLTELCQELKNWFDRERHTGAFAVVGGNITADFLQDGQFFRIVGSVFNDGIHKYPANDLTDETFTGSIWALAIPTEILKMAEDIAAYRNKYEIADSAAMSPFTSESFGGYSYSKSVATSGSGGSSGWKAVFASRMNAWRKLKL